MRTGGQNDRARLVDVPFAFIAMTSERGAAAVSAPAVPHDLQMKTRRAAQISLKRQRFLLLVPPAQEPVNGKRTWSEAHRHMRIFKTSGRELQAGKQARTAHPVRVEDTTFPCACRLNPAQGRRTFTAVVGGKNQIPQGHCRDSQDYVDGKKAPHTLPLYCDGTSDVPVRARGQWCNSETFCRLISPVCGKGRSFPRSDRFLCTIRSGRRVYNVRRALPHP